MHEKKQPEQNRTQKRKRRERWRREDGPSREEREDGREASGRGKAADHCDHHFVSRKRKSKPQSSRHAREENKMRRSTLDGRREWCG